MEKDTKYRLTSSLQRVNEKDITAFCKKCQNVRQDNGCRVLPDGIQAENVFEDWCGWGEIGDVKGSVTRKGFDSKFKQESQPRQPVKYKFF